MIKIKVKKVYLDNKLIHESKLKKKNWIQKVIIYLSQFLL